MRPFGSTLRARLVWSHIAVVAVGVIVLVIAGGQLGDAFVDDHLQSMAPMMHDRVEALDVVVFEDGVSAAFNRALWWAAVVSAAVALLAATFATRRLLTPIDDIRGMTRRMALGAYHEPIPLPNESELAALASDVNALAASLDQSEQRRSRLVGEVAHELRTPVATLKGYLEGLLDGVFEADDEILSAAISEATRLERLAADLSALSKAEEGRIDLHLTQLDVRDVVDQIETRLRSQFLDNNVTLTVEPLPPLPTIADADRVAQILTNLVGNALAYTPAGGHVTISANSNSDEVRVNVADTGRGLTEEQLILVFERFYRADRSVTGGSGIGLTIARNLARRHHGDVTAASEGPGLGATFSVILPRAPATRIASGAGREARDPQ